MSRSRETIIKEEMKSNKRRRCALSSQSGDDRSQADDVQHTHDERADDGLFIGNNEVAARNNADEHEEGDVDGHEEEDGDVEFLGASVNLKRSGERCGKGEVFAWFCKRYPATLRVLAEQVESSESIQAKLEGIARIVEHKNTTKRWVVKQHKTNYKRTISDAVGEVKAYMGIVQKAFDSLKVEKHDDIFEEKIWGPTQQCLERAKEAQTKLSNIVADLEANMKN